MNLHVHHYSNISLFQYTGFDGIDALYIPWTKFIFVKFVKGWYHLSHLAKARSVLSLKLKDVPIIMNE